MDRVINVRNLAALKKLATVLSERVRPMSAVEIAAKFDCSLPIAYMRIRSLKKHGVTVKASKAKREVGENGLRRGPATKAYLVTSDKALKSFLTAKSDPG